jgi:hypothetical protein
MQKEQKPAPSASEATDAILEALKITNPPAEIILIEMYIEKAFQLHRREQMHEDHANTMKTISNAFK